MNLDGTGYQSLYGAIDFVDPGSLTLDGSTIFGTTNVNGPLGTLFAYGPVSTPEPSALALATTGLVVVMVRWKRTSRAKALINPLLHSNLRLPISGPIPRFVHLYTYAIMPLSRLG